MIVFSCSCPRLAKNEKKEKIEEERKTIKEYFSDKVVSHQAVVNHFNELRGINQKDLIKKNK